MSEKQSGGPAFPTPGTPGMTLRDWFAGQALVMLGHLLAMPNAELRAGGPIDEAAVAEQAFHFADAMLDARGGCP